MNRRNIRVGLSQPVALLLAMVTCSAALASTAHIAQPWRADAVVLGRDEAFGTERFLHELTFRHLQALPSATGNGIRGTGGSVSSRRLYFDFRFRQDFGFRDDQNGFLLDIQRGEDLDGPYQRQLVGFRQNLGDKTEVWLQGDVFSDKAESDIYLSTRHHLTDQSWLHATVILPDYYFNDKTDTDDRFEKKPGSWFLQWHSQGSSAAEGTTVSVNLSPDSRFSSQRQALTVSNESQRAAISHRQQAGDWLFSLHLEGEHTRRDYWLQDPEENRTTGFERDHIKARGSVTLTPHTLLPTFGLAWLQLDETGYFGRELDDNGSIRRREPTVFGEVTLQTSRNTTVSPGIYLSAPEIRQTFGHGEDRRHTGFTGKLAVPFATRLSANNQAILTLNPTFYLHKFGFGGGNLQLHWPL
ncbi:MAG: hypothetical protein HLUCCX14_04190 [Marinobacter excellens HL-55]|uniref:Alginate export domain-containing protein n=1 Tax=Marinobacter excellens HL-55 TaxID=1305731 RepID=A0A0P8BN44_9GAMM|nr:MAG: hypothetical protein HLUCCX14_04190 [Marinobacter excellens HL-55]